MIKNFYSQNSYNWQTNSDGLFCCAWHLLFSNVQKRLEDVKGHKLLDAGCGMGAFSPYVKLADYCGIDISSENIAYAYKKYRCNLVVGDILKTGFNDDSFDSLVSIEVIEHLTIDDLLEFLREVKRITKNGGKIVFTTPNLYYLWGIIPWSFWPVRRRLTFFKLVDGIRNGYIDENYNLPVRHYRFRPSFLKSVLADFFEVKEVESTYWYNNRAIHGFCPRLQFKLLNFSNIFKTKLFLLGSQLVIECENIK